MRFRHLYLAVGGVSVLLSGQAFAQSAASCRKAEFRGGAPVFYYDKACMAKLKPAKKVDEKKTVKVRASSPKVRSVQKLLAAKGYKPGTADGVMGGNTKKAIGQYYKKYGLKGSKINAVLAHLKSSPKSKKAAAKRARIAAIKKAVAAKRAAGKTKAKTASSGASKAADARKARVAAIKKAVAAKRAAATKTKAAAAKKQTAASKKAAAAKKSRVAAIKKAVAAKRAAATKTKAAAVKKQAAASKKAAAAKKSRVAAIKKAVAAKRAAAAKTKAAAVKKQAAADAVASKKAAAAKKSRVAAIKKAVAVKRVAAAKTKAAAVKKQAAADAAASKKAAAAKKSRVAAIKKAVAAKRAAAAKTAAKPKAAAPAMKTASKGDKNVADLQTLLAGKGQYAGKVDGTMNIETRKSVINYYYAHNLDVGKGTIAQAVHKDLKSGGAVKTVAAATVPAAKAKPKSSGNKVVDIQSMLAEKGLYSGKSNGLLDAPTRKSILSYYKKHKLKRNGRTIIDTVHSHLSGGTA